MNNIIYFSSAWDKVHFFRFQWTFLNDRDVRFGLPRHFTRFRARTTINLLNNIDQLDLRDRQLLRYTHYDKTVQTQIDVDYRKEIPTATDELCKPKYLQQFFLHVSDKSAQFEITAKLYPA